MNDNISDKDKKDWQKFISGKEKLPNKDLKDTANKSIKTKLIDLHGFTLENANQEIENFSINRIQGLASLVN